MKVEVEYLVSIWSVTSNSMLLITPKSVVKLWLVIMPRPLGGCSEGLLKSLNETQWVSVVVCVSVKPLVARLQIITSLSFTPSLLRWPASLV
jgi:hypothetical protein